MEKLTEASLYLIKDLAARRAIYLPGELPRNQFRQKLGDKVPTLLDHITALESEIAEKDARIAELEKVAEAAQRTFDALEKWRTTPGRDADNETREEFWQTYRRAVVDTQAALAPLNEKERRA